MSIRLRLTCWYSAVLLLGLGIFGAGMWLVLSHRLTTVLESQLGQRVEGLRTVLELESKLKDADLRLELWEFAREVPEGALMRLHDAQGRELLPTAGRQVFPVAPGAVPEGYRTVVWEGHAYRVLSRRIEAAGATFDVVVGASLEGTAAILAEFRKLLFLMIPAVLAAACLGDTGSAAGPWRRWMRSRGRPNRSACKACPGVFPCRRRATNCSGCRRPGTGCWSGWRRR